MMFAPTGVDPDYLLSLFGMGAPKAPVGPNIGASFASLPQAHTGAEGEIPGVEPNLGPSLSSILSQGAGGGGLMPTPTMSPALSMEFARNPDKIAAEAAKAGIPPPPLPQGPSLGESLEPSSGVPLPRPRPEAAGGSAFNAMTNSKPGAAGKNPIIDAMKGLKAPITPAPQKVSTPSPVAPKMGDIKSGEFMALLAALGMGGGGGGGGGMKLPQTLGAALGGR